MQNERSSDVLAGTVRWSSANSLWWSAMALATLIGGVATFSWQAFAVFVVLTGTVLLFGRSLGSHRKRIHDSFACPQWPEYTLVYAGV